MDKNKHKLYMAQILSLIFKDKDICNVFPLFRLHSYNFFPINPSTFYNFFPINPSTFCNFLPIKAFSIGRGNLSIIMMV